MKKKKKCNLRRLCAPTSISLLSLTLAHTLPRPDWRENLKESCESSSAIFLAEWGDCWYHDKAFRKMRRNSLCSRSPLLTFGFPGCRAANGQQTMAWRRNKNSIAKRIRHIGTPAAKTMPGTARRSVDRHKGNSLAIWRRRRRFGGRYGSLKRPLGVRSATRPMGVDCGHSNAHWTIGPLSGTCVYAGRRKQSRKGRSGAVVWRRNRKGTVGSLAGTTTVSGQNISMTSGVQQRPPLMQGHGIAVTTRSPVSNW